MDQKAVGDITESWLSARHSTRFLTGITLLNPINGLALGTATTMMSIFTDDETGTQMNKLPEDAASLVSPEKANHLLNPGRKLGERSYNSSSFIHV